MGKGCFMINTYKSKTKLGTTASLQFRITQHIRDFALLNSFIKFLGCGIILTGPTESSCNFILRDLSSILKKFIPFLNKYPLLGTKKLDFMDFCKVAYLMKDKVHLTKEGLLEIEKIKSGINTSRKI
jgi:hypothetical protein